MFYALYKLKWDHLIFRQLYFQLSPQQQKTPSWTSLQDDIRLSQMCWMCDWSGWTGTAADSSYGLSLV